MRNKLLLGLSALALSTISARATAMQFGVQAGVNVASASMTNALGTAINSGTANQFMGGIFVESSGEILFIQPELSYIDKFGVKYLAVPLLLKVKIPLGPLKPFLLAGPEVAFRISGGTATAKTIDFGVNLGGGLELAIAPTLSVHITARYALGIVDTGGDPSPLASLKTRGIHFMGGVAFGF